MPGEPHSMEELIAACESKDLVRWTIPDLNGNARTKIIPGKMCRSFIKGGGRDMCSAVFSLACNDFDPCIPWFEENGYPDCAVLPEVGSFHSVNWSNCSATVGQVICSTKWRNGQPVQFDARNVALAQVKRLNDLGFDIFSAFEPEWRLFIKTDDDSEETGDCYSWQETSVSPYSSTLTHKYEQLLYDIYSALSSAGLTIEAMHTEYGRGQMEITMVPRWGLRAPDEGFLYKGVVKQVAANHGYIASFISTPYDSQSGNGLHFNHSIWSLDKQINAFHDPSQENGMSEIMQHWLAGLTTHAPAITALTSPTVNCYRRLHKPFTPTFADWELWSRNATFRVKVSTKGQGGTYIENRAPSSAANPYLVFAATVAAGIDGLQRKLQLPPQAQRDKQKDVQLPENMSDGLEVLKEDTIISEALGPELANFYAVMKTEFDMKQVGSEPTSFKKERASYLEFL